CVGEPAAQAPGGGGRPPPLARGGPVSRQAACRARDVGREGTVVAADRRRCFGAVDLERRGRADTWCVDKRRSISEVWVAVGGCLRGGRDRLRRPEWRVIIC